jgi:hypothetical protein
MKVYHGLENYAESVTVIDQDEDFIITDFKGELSDAIPLLFIQPYKTTILLEDYGFFSESGKCYLYLDMIFAFLIKDGEEKQTDMFLLQLEEELIAEVHDKEFIYFVSEHNRPLVQKWAASYQVRIEFILL